MINNATHCKELVIAIRQQAEKQSYNFLPRREAERLLRQIFLAMTDFSIFHNKSENS